MTDTTAPKRKRLSPIQGVAILLLLVVGVLAAWWTLRAATASPLQPVASGTHDFGVVLINGKKETVEHTFLLRNTTDAPLRILKTVPSCGCTWAGEGEPNLAAGATMELPVTMSVKDSHKIDSSITVVLEDQTPLVLWLSAEGRLAKGMRHVPEYLRLKPKHPDASARLHLEWWEETPPPDPSIQTAASLEVDFHGWELQSRGKKRLGTPDRYAADMSIHAVDTPPLDGFVSAVMPDGQRTSIPINPRGSLGETRDGPSAHIPGTPEFEFNPDPVQPSAPEVAPEPAPDDR